jgi:site-specific recombinase XerD
MAGHPARAPCRSAVLHDQRHDARAALVAAAARAELRRTAAAAGVRRRFAPHQLRHAHAVEMAREGVPLIVIQRQLGHSNLGITSVYLQGIHSGEIIDTVHARRAPMIPVSASLRL